MIEINNLSFRYALAHENALKDINLYIKKETLHLLIGPSGCGKTTLLRHMKRELWPNGIKSGSITYDREPLESMDTRKSVSEIGFLFQNPASQIVMDTVWHEIAFGLENMGMPLPEMKRCVAEVVNYFNLHEIYDKNPQELSGGQQQILNLASIMAMHPKVLLLDEPTTMLDPVARKNFLNLLIRLKNDFQMTIVMVAHNLEDVLELADTCTCLENGRVTFTGTPEEYMKQLSGEFSFLLPQNQRLLYRLGFAPVFDRKKIRTIVSNASYHDIITEYHGDKICLQAKHLYASYGNHEVLKNLSLDLKEGEIYTVTGANGSGKSTLIKCLTGQVNYKGKIKTKKRVICLPQDPTLLFVKDTLREDLMETGKGQESRRNSLIRQYHLHDLLDFHPFDLSGGQQQMAALIKVLLADPDILLLDEPTKGIDRLHVKEFASQIKQLAREGLTVLCVTHDLEFAAMVSDRISILFDGKIESTGTPEEFLLQNYFYTTECARLTRNFKVPLILPERMEAANE